MLTTITYLVAGILVAAYAYYQMRKQRKAKALGKSPEELRTALHQLGGKIETYSRKTIHPREYLASPDFREASSLFASSNVSLDLIRQYITAANGYLSSAALDALSRHPDRQELFNTVMTHFHTLNLDAMYFALRYFWTLKSRPPVGAPFVLAQDWWAGNAQLVESFREYLVERMQLSDMPEFGAYLDWSMSSAPAPIQNLLNQFDDPLVYMLKDQLRRWASMRLDEKFLTAFGRFWRRGPEEELLFQLPPWQEALDLAENAVTAVPPRSVLITGGARTGKTSFLKLLGERLSQRGWRVFEASAAELQADQFYIGMLEGRIRQTVAELDAGKYVAWFVMDVVQMAESGTHRGQSASILEQILPAVISGRLVILAEASPEGANRLFQKHPSLRAQMEVYKLEPFDEENLQRLASSVASKLAEINDIAIDDGTVSQALQLSNQYLGGGSLPGLVVDLLKRAMQHAKAAYEPAVDHATLHAALSQITGLPVSILDDQEKIDLSTLRRFFSERVIGQDAAVSTIVDRIAMLKAGLTDPYRPVGVFLFVGPTGTGKTELAKVLATYLFGSPERMTRLDMSEFQSPYSVVKIIGEAGRNDSDSLIDRVRKQPFSVILLDEFEKAHPNVWDLFLQIFDDGRLSDAAGKAADFRHTIIVLTSNLGATDHRGAGLGFIPSEDAYGEEQLMKAVSRAFRPEFVNRLDKIVVFKPLSRDLMREILHKELRQVLERRGLRNREWVVEWEPSAVDFLLDKGFSMEMGARPLKRAIDQYLLAPLASTLVEHRFPEGDQFLFVRSNGRAIEVEFVDPDADEPAEAAPDTPTPTADASLPSMILQPQGLETEHASLEAHFVELNARLQSAEWNEMKTDALALAGSPDIWSNAGRHAVFARVALIDRINQAMATAERLKRRLENYRKPAGQPSRELVARLALQLHLVSEAITDALTGAPIDAVIQIEPVLEGGGDTDASHAWCSRLGGMYRQWSERRHMQFEELSPPRGTDGPTLIHVSGFGAFRTLANETGLHLSENTESTGRISARVKVAPGPAEEPRADQAYHTFVALFTRGDESSAIVRRYRDNPAPLVRDAKAGWRTGRIDMVMNGDFDLIGALQ